MRLINLIKGEYIFSILTKCISILMTLIQSIIVARYLGAELLGVSSYVTSIATIGSIIITFGMHQAYPYLKKKFGKDKIYHDFLSIIILLYIFFMILAFALTFLPFVSQEIGVVILLIPMMGYSKIIAYTCLIESPNIRNLWWIIISFLDILFITFLWIFTERNYVWMVIILIFAELLKSIVYTAILRPKLRIHKGLIPLLIELCKYGFFPMVALLMTTLNYKIDVLILKQYSYISSAMLGVYSIGIQMAERIILIPDTLKGVLISRLAKGSNEKEVAYVCRIAFCVSCCVCLCFILFGKWIVLFLYGTEYSGAYTVLSINAFSTIFVGFFKLIAQYNIINKKQILNIYMLSIAIIINIIFDLILIPIWGINGAAVATSIGNFLCGIIFVLWFSHVSHIPIIQMIILQKSDIHKIKSYINK